MSLLDLKPSRPETANQSLGAFPERTISTVNRPLRTPCKRTARFTSDESLVIQFAQLRLAANYQVPDLILVQARVLARSASRPKGLRVYSVVIAASVGYRLGLLRIDGSTWSVASLFGFG